MKKFVLLLLCFFVLCVTVFAETPDFYFAEDVILSGMGNRSWEKGYAPDESYGYWTAYLPIGTDKDVSEITLRLEVENEAVSPFQPQNMEVTVRRNADGIFPARLNYKLYSDFQNGDYPARVCISGQDADGNNLSESFPFVVRIRDGYQNTEKPSVQMQVISSDLIVGADGECSLLIENTSSTLEMQNCILKFSDPTGDLLPAQSDTLLAGSLLPGESKTIAIPISASPNAKVANYQIKAELSYETIQGQGSWQETFTVPVMQEIRLEHGEITMGDSVIQGGTGGITVSFMNMGAGEVKNIRMTLNLGDFVNNQTVLVGDLLPGSSTNGKLSFGTTKAPVGSAEGELTMVYEDAFGNEESFTEPVSIIVEEPKPVTAPDADSNTKETSTTTWVLSGVCAVLAVALIAQSILLRNKIHKLEEDKL